MPAFDFVGFTDENVAQIYHSDHRSAHGEAAGQEIVKRVRLRHIGRLVNRLGSKDDAEDVLSIACFKILMAILDGKFTPDGSPSPFNRWSSRIVANTENDVRDGKKREAQSVSIHSSQDEDAIDDIFDHLSIGESERQIEDNFLACQEPEYIYYLASISNLPAEDIKVFLLIVIEDFKPREVASMTNIPVEEVSRIKWRVANRFRRVMQDERNRRSW